MIFTEQFYPTPTEVANKMLSYVDLKRVKRVLEPSAGTGNLVKSITSKWSACTVDCVEIDPKLRAILKDAGYPVIASDFLTASIYTRYDLILMNPPFRNGIKHLLKAIRLIEKSGGQIVCLLNASNVLHPSSIQSKMLCHKLENYNATIEYLEGAFSDAEVKTNVDVALIYLDIPAQVGSEDLPLEELTTRFNIRDVSEDVPDECRDLVDYDIINQIVRQFSFEAQLGLSLLDNFYEYAKYVPTDGTDNSLLTLTVSGCAKGTPKKDIYNKYLSDLRIKYWRALFSSKEMRQLMTEKVYRDYMSQIDRLSCYDVNYENIYAIRLELSKFKMQSLEEAIMDMFNKLTYEHSMGNNSNIHYYNGWKTNNACAINDKVILSCYGIYDSRFDSWSVYHIRDTLAELEKILNYFSKGISCSLDCFDRIRDRFVTSSDKYVSGTKIHCAYFDIAFYKKGSCHIWFTDKDVIQRFNYFGGKTKNWLPPYYGKVSYEELDPESKDIVDSFEGRQSYFENVSSGVYNFELNTIKLLN